MNRTFRWFTLAVILSLTMGLIAASAPASNAIVWQEKVDPLVLSTAQEGETEILVFMSEQADLSGASILKSKIAKGTYVYKTLTSMAETSQKPIRKMLDFQGIAYQSFWITNMLWVRADIHAIEEIAKRPDVSHIYANPQVRLSLPEPDFALNEMAPNVVDTIEWNILKINADDVWAAGYTGQGAVIGGQDTGYDWDHPALINQYRGWDGVAADHDYNWFDATTYGSPDIPVDPHGHGTHTMGTMVGNDGGSNQVGVAPGARWIGCRNMNSSGVGSPATYTACYQWFVAPTRTDGSEPRPDLAPDVINNSWSCPYYEGCTQPDVLFDAVEAVRAAGILTAHSAGNDGPSCGTVNEPATIYPGSFSVGSTTSSDTISNFSSRGPVTVDGSYRMKPQVSAPGSNIRSTISGGGYGIKSGTSMAAPHVAGLVALLISAQPVLAGQVDVLETLIQDSALQLYTTNDCGSDIPTSYPNHTYGWGRIDAWVAYQAIPTQSLGLEKKVSATAVAPGDVLTYTITVTNKHQYSDTHHVILEDTIPANTNIVGVTGNHAVTGNKVTWDIGDLAPKASSQVMMAVQVATTATAGVLVNQDYSARSDESLMVMGQPVSSYIHMLAVEKTAPPATTPGALLRYTLNVSNLQPDMATHHVILEDIIPEHTDFITATLPHTLTGKTITWAIGDLAAGTTAQVTLTIQIPLTTPLGTIVNNQYSAYSDEANLVIGDPVATTIHKLAVEKSAPQVVVRGYPLTYTLKVTNLQSDAITHQVLLTDTIPENTEFITATGNYSVTGELVTWEIGNLGMDASESVEFVVLVAVTATEGITNAAYGVISTEADIPAKGQAVHTFVQTPGIAVSSGQSGVIFDPCDPSSALIYTHQITNKGNYTDSFDLSVKSNLEWASLAADHFTLASGESAIFDVEINPPCPTPPGAVDSATIVISSQADPSVSGLITDTTLVGYRNFLPAIFVDQ